LKSPDILPAVAANPTIAILGPGRLGRTLARELLDAGYSITELISRNNSASQRAGRKLAKSLRALPATVETAKFDAGLLWLCVPDREIAGVGRELAARGKGRPWKGETGRGWRGKIVFHSSGALASDELNALRREGAGVASVHPFMTFVEGSSPRFEGVPFALEGDAVAVRVARKIVKSLGGAAFPLRKKDKTAYHAWATFCSPLLIAVLVTAEQAAGIAGYSPAQARRKMLPIVMQTLANYAALGPAGASSGPIVRGDADIVRRHLQVLNGSPEIQEAYRALARSALGHLPVQNREKLKKVLHP
jgi:predicted short-subunit dehydrogenase-like oxidoreductase (DUF2520 family)